MTASTTPPFTGASQTVSVWAPTAERIVHLVTDGVRTPMRAGDDGWWHSPEPVRVGSEYSVSIDGGDLRPDPRSLLQPEGPHGPSQVVDLGAFEWSDKSWTGRGMEGAVFYELHVGTFTEAGTFAAAEERLDHLDRKSVV